MTREQMRKGMAGLGREGGRKLGWSRAAAGTVRTVMAWGEGLISRQVLVEFCAA